MEEGLANLIVSGAVGDVGDFPCSRRTVTTIDNNIRTVN